jgi:hypothetical protein
MSNLYEICKILLALLNMECQICQKFSSILLHLKTGPKLNILHKNMT